MDRLERPDLHPSTEGSPSSSQRLTVQRIGEVSSLKSDAEGSEHIHSCLQGPKDPWLQKPQVSGLLVPYPFLTSQECRCLILPQHPCTCLPGEEKVGKLESWGGGDMPAPFLSNASLQSALRVLFQSAMKHISGQISHRLSQLRGKMSIHFPSSIKEGNRLPLPAGMFPASTMRDEIIYILLVLGMGGRGRG